MHACDETAVSIDEMELVYFAGEELYCLELLVSILEVFEDSIKKSVSRCVTIIKMIVSGCFSVDVKSFYCVKMNTFFFELYYLHNVYISIGMHVLC